MSRQQFRFLLDAIAETIFGKSVLALCPDTGVFLTLRAEPLVLRQLRDPAFAVMAAVFERLCDVDRFTTASIYSVLDESRVN